MPTVQRLGYALEAAYIGIVANASGFVSMNTTQEAVDVAKWVFLACLPFGVLALAAMWKLVKKQPASWEVSA